MFEGPRPAKTKEFKELTRFLSKIFGINIIRNLCHVYQPKEEFVRNNKIIKYKSKIVSCVGFSPQEYVVNRSVLKVAGIGGVSTDKSMRGKGLMSKLLNYCIDIMKKEKYDISILWGARKRYNTFGWENAGRLFRFIITVKAIRNYPVLNVKPRIYKGDRKQLLRIKKTHEEEKWYTKRDYKLVLKRANFKTYTVSKGSRFAYVCTDSKKGEVYECGGDPNLIAGLIRFHFENYLSKENIDSLKCDMPYYHTPLRDILLDGSAHWWIDNIGMVKIINLKSTFKKFIHQMNEKRGNSKNKTKGSVALKIKESGEIVTLEFDRKVRITDKRAKVIIRLKEIDMVRLVFGIDRPSVLFGNIKGVELLNAVFPLDFFSWVPDHV